MFRTHITLAIAESDKAELVEQTAAGTELAEVFRTIKEPACNYKSACLVDHELQSDDSPL